VELERVAPAELEGYCRTSRPGSERPGSIVTEEGTLEERRLVSGEATGHMTRRAFVSALARLDMAPNEHATR
jgi:hypothetical protein